MPLPLLPEVQVVVCKPCPDRRPDLKTIYSAREEIGKKLLAAKIKFSEDC